MQRSTILALISAVLLLSAGNAIAAGDITQGNEMNGLLRMLYDAASEWSPRLHGYALKLLASLALIQLIWTFMPLVMKQADLGEIVGELIRFFMIIGFFYAVIEYSVPWATAVVDSFREAAGNASGLGRALQPGDMFAVAIDFSRTVVQGISVFSPGKAILIALVGCLVLICFAFIAAFMFVTLVESYVIINASVLFFGFGGSQWTREFAIAPLRFVVAVGAKLFVLTLIVGIIVTSAKSWLAAYTNDEASLMTLAGLALVCAYLAKTIPELIGGMISGTSMGGGSTLGGMAAAGAAGAAAVATGGVAAAGAAAAKGAVGAASGGGLAASISSSIAGGTSAAASGGSAASNAASGLGASTGGSAAGASTGSSAAGSRVGGSAAPQASGTTAQASSGGQPAFNQAGKAAQGGDNKSQQNAAAGPQAAPASGDGSSNMVSQIKGDAGRVDKAQSQGGDVIGAADKRQRSEDSGISGHQITSGLTRGAGILSAIAVPGMEGSAGLSLGAGAPQTVPDSGSEADLPMAPSSAEASAEPTQTESNVIRPASDTNSTHDRLSSLNVQGTASDNDQPEK